MNVLLSGSFWHSLNESVTFFFSHHFILSVTAKVLVSFTGQNDFFVCDASLHGLTKRSEMFEAIELYRIQVS